MNILSSIGSSSDDAMSTGWQDSNLTKEIKWYLRRFLSLATVCVRSFKDKYWVYYILWLFCSSEIWLKFVHSRKLSKWLKLKRHFKMVSRTLNFMTLAYKQNQFNTNSRRQFWQVYITLLSIWLCAPNWPKPYYFRN